MDFTRQPATVEEGAMSELDIERQDLERMTDQQFLKAYGISKEFWRYKNQALLKKSRRRPMSAQLARSPVGQKMNAMYGSTCPGCGRSTNPDRCVCEGYQDFKKPEPYAVCLAGKPVKQFDYYEQARQFHDNWKKKLYREGNTEKANKITLMPVIDEAGSPAQQAAIAINMKKHHKKPKHMSENDDWDDGEWDDIPDAHATVKPTQPTRYPEAVLRAIERNPNMRADIIRDYERKQGVKEVAPPGAKAERMVKHIKKSLSKDGKLSNKDKAIAYATAWKAHNAGKVEETELDEISKDTLKKYVKANANDQVQHASHQSFKSGQAGDRYNKADAWDQRTTKRERGLDRALRKLGEESSTSSEEAESAILKRIMVAHLDLLKQFGPEKVMQAVEEVAYGVGDLDEIGSSDVSAWVRQVEQILGEPDYDDSFDDADEFGMPGSEFFPDEKLDEKWSQKYKRSINCAHPKGFSQRAHCAGKKK